MSEPINECGATNADRTQKHIELNNAISEIVQLLKHTNHVLEKITGAEQVQSVTEKQKAPQPRSPSLQEVLDQSPEKIRDTCSAVHGTLEEIELVLF